MSITLNNPPPPTSDNISFLPYPTLFLKVDAMCVSPLIVMRKFFTSISGATLLERLPPEINERILTMAMRGSNYNWESHVLQTCNNLRNICRFWRIGRFQEHSSKRVHFVRRSSVKQFGRCKNYCKRSKTYQKGWFQFLVYYCH